MLGSFPSNTLLYYQGEGLQVGDSYCTRLHPHTSLDRCRPTNLHGCRVQVVSRGSGLGPDLYLTRKKKHAPIKALVALPPLPK